MEKNQKIINYQYFFDDQIKEAELEQKAIVQAPICQLLHKEEIVLGYIDHVNVARGHVVIKFPKNRGPRLKIQKSITIIKKKAFIAFGDNVNNWDCRFVDFCSKYEYRSKISELMPLYYMHGRDSRYDYVGCSAIDSELFEIMRNSVSSGKSLSVLVFTPFPPVDYFHNLNSYMDRFYDNPELLMEPKMDYEDWHPEELAYDPQNETAIAETIAKTLDEQDICVLQGPPGTGKSYTIAQIIARYLTEGKTVCATTMANKGLIELVKQPPLEKFLKEGRISKTNLSADEMHQAKGLKPATKGIEVPKGELLCSTNYVLSYAYNPRTVAEYGLPTYDIVIIEEASQAYLTTIIAFKALGKKCLIVGDPMQLPPIVTNPSKSIYRTWNVNTQMEGLKTFALGTNVKSYRITTTFRLTPDSAALTGIFYDNRFSSVQKNRVDYSKISSSLFPTEGGVLFYYTDDFKNEVYSDTALNLIGNVINSLDTNYPKRSVAIITPFKETVKMLQKTFLNETRIEGLTIETIDRIQGMTVDYAILYLPGRHTGFALNERRFNVATSRSRSTTLIITDIPLFNLHTCPLRVRSFLQQSKKIKDIVIQSSQNRGNTARDDIKYMYPGLEDIVDVLLDNNIEFSHEGDVDLLDKNGLVIASSGMLLHNYKLAIDPIDSDSQAVFESAGYKVVSSEDFNINMLK